MIDLFRWREIPLIDRARAIYESAVLAPEKPKQFDRLPQVPESSPFRSFTKIPSWNRATKHIMESARKCAWL